MEFMLDSANLTELEQGIKYGGHGILILAETAVIGLKGTLSQLSVAAFQQRDERTAGKLMLYSVFIHGIGEFKVCISENSADGIGAVCHFSGCGK